MRKRFRSGRDESLEEGTIEGLFFGLDLGDSWISLALAVAVLLIVFILLPLLGVALELIVLFFLLWSGVVGRFVLGRPWTVEAAPLDGVGEAVTVPVKGWRRAGEAVERLAREIEVTGRPEHFVGPDPGAIEGSSVP